MFRLRKRRINDCHNWIVIKHVVVIMLQYKSNSSNFLFQLQTTDGKLKITGTSGVAAAFGFNHFLKYFCGYGTRQFSVDIFNLSQCYDY